MLPKSSINFYLLVKMFALIVCIGLFLLLMAGIWTKFISEETTMSVKIEIEDIDEKIPPCVTACPFTAFKTPGRFSFHPMTFLQC